MARTTPRPSAADASATHARQGKRRLTLTSYHTEKPHLGSRGHATADANSSVEASQSPFEDDNWNNILKAEPLVSAVSNGPTTSPLSYESPPAHVVSDGVFISPFAALEADQPTSYECCGNCMGALPNVNSQYAASCALWFCICCHSALPASLYPNEEPGKRLLRRCTACIQAAPARGDELRARLPVEMQRGVEVAQALAQVYREVHVIFKTSVHLPPHIQPKMQEIEVADEQWQKRREEFGLKLSRMVQQHGVATSESLFFEWVEVENQRVLLEMRRAEVWSEVVASEGVTVSSVAVDLMEAAGIGVHEPPRKKFKSDVTKSSASCPHCHSVLALPGPSKDLSSGLCDCCERCLPLAAMKKAPNHSGRGDGNEGTPTRCLSCGLAPKRSRAKRSISVRDGLGRTCQAMSRAVAAVIDELKRVKETSVLQDPHYRHIAECVKSAQAERKAASARHAKVFAMGWMPVDQSREIYEEVVSLDENLGRELSAQLRVLLEAAVTCTRQVPHQHLELAAGVFDKIELSKQLQSYLMNRQNLAKATRTRRSNSVAKQPSPAAPPPQQIAPTRVSQPVKPVQVTPSSSKCSRCDGTLSDVGPSQVNIALCDCCTRAVPESLLTSTPSRGGAIICQNCSIEHQRTRVNAGNWPSRPSNSRILTLSYETRILRAFLDEQLAKMQSTLNANESQSVAFRVAAVANARLHLDNVIAQHRQMMSKGRVTPELSKNMYVERVGADSGVEKSLRNFLKSIRRICQKRSISIDQQLSSVIASQVKVASAPTRIKTEDFNSRSASGQSTATTSQQTHLASQVPVSAQRAIPTCSREPSKSVVRDARDTTHNRSASIHRSRDESHGRSKSQIRRSPSTSSRAQHRTNSPHTHRGPSKCVRLESKLMENRSPSRRTNREASRRQSQSQLRRSRDRSPSRHISRDESRGRREPLVSRLYSDAIRRLHPPQDTQRDEQNRRREPSKSVQRDVPYSRNQPESRTVGDRESRGRSKSQHRSNQADRMSSRRHESSRTVHRERDSDRLSRGNTSQAKRDEPRERSKSQQRTIELRARSKSTHRGSQRRSPSRHRSPEDSCGRSVSRRSPSRHQPRHSHNHCRGQDDSASRRHHRSRSRSSSRGRSRHRQARSKSHTESQHSHTADSKYPNRSQARPRSRDRHGVFDEKPRSYRGRSHSRGRSRSSQVRSRSTTRRSRSRSRDRAHDGHRRQSDHRRSRSPPRSDRHRREKSRDRTRERSNPLSNFVSARR